MRYCKKLISLSVCFVLLLSFHVPASALSASDVTSPAAMLMDAATGKVLYDKNMNEVRACASITKVMTLLLVFEAVDGGKIKMEDTVTTSAHASSMGGSDIWLEPGETMTVDEMIKATAVASANDAAVALAEHICGTEEAFVAEMNAKAKKLGMTKTVFKNCNGLDEDGHVTSAYDIALMSRELIKHKKIFDYTTIWIDNLRDGKTQLVNTNKLLKSYKGITGLKTGTTGDAGSCISATAKRDGLALIAVVLGSSTGTERFKDAATLLNFGFANYALAKATMPEGALIPITVTNGMESSVDTNCDVTGGFLVSKGGDKDIKSKVIYEESVEAPVARGQKVGVIRYSLGEETLCEYPIVTTREVDRISFGKVFSKLLGFLLAM